MDELPSASIPALDKQTLGKHANMAARERRPTRVVGITLSKGATPKDILFDVPVKITSDSALEKLIKQRTGKTRKQLAAEGITIDINAS